MSAKLLRGLHIIALCIFVGSIPSHIILGILAQFAQDGAAFAVYHQAKYILTSGLTGSGIGLTLLTGLMLGLSNRRVFKMRWFQIKLALVLLVVLNGAVILTPIAQEMKELAVAAVGTGSLSSQFHVAETKETIAGAVNLLSLLFIIFLAVFKPKFGNRTVEATNGHA